MLPELAHLALIFAVVCALILSITIGVRCHQQYPPSAQQNPRIYSLSYLCFAFISLSVALLAYSFYQDDFSVAYIAQHANRALPVFYKVTALWSGHEGSMLFWLFSLSLWTALFTRFNRHFSPAITSRTLLILSVLIVLFGIFILGFSNPFLRLDAIPSDGRDLNPMLQDIGFLFHPPLLYLGYVGLAVIFAISLAALLVNDLSQNTSARIRPWLLSAWFFLTLGIATGAFWAYYELGWGGFWFWDPVENASLIPWLIATALLHLTARHQYQGLFPYWVILLGLFSFCFSVLGTFMVRSGIMSSVHAFAVSPSRAFALFILLNIIILVALSIFTAKAKINKPLRHFNLLSLECAVLVFTILMLFMVSTVLLGTFYPMLLDLLKLNAASVGAPYFNTLFIPVILTTLALLIITPDLIDKKSAPQIMLRASYSVFVSTIGAGLFFYYADYSVSIISFSLTLICIAVLLSHLLFALKSHWSWHKKLRLLMVHGGLAIAVFGGMMSQYYHQEKNTLMTVNQSIAFSNFTITLNSVQYTIGPNYTAQQAQLSIYHQQQLLGVAKPEQRHYTVRNTKMTEVGLRSYWLNDFYIILGEKITDTHYAIKIQYKPYIRLLWWGILIMLAASITPWLVCFTRNKENDKCRV